MSTIWDIPRPSLPTLSGPARAEVCVVGLGGAGLAAIAELVAHDHDVIGVEAAVIGGGAAGRNGGFLLAGLADPFDETVARFGDALATAIYQHTLDEARRMAEAHPDDVRLIGSLRIAGTDDEINACASHVHALKSHGFAAESYVGPEGTGVLIPDDGVYHPVRCLRRTAELVQARGARLFGHTTALAVSPGEVATSRGRIRCDRVIVAIDGDLERLLPELQLRVRTARLQMLATGPASDAAFRLPVYYRDGYEYWQQLPGGEIALGGFRDRGGDAEWTNDPAPGAAVQELLEQFLRTHLKTAAPVTHRWAACVAYSRNRLPVLEEVRPGVFAVGAYCGTGNIASRLCGRAAAQLALGHASSWAELVQRASRA